MFGKPVAASFTMVLELLLLALFYVLLAVIYSASYQDQSVLLVSTLWMTFAVSLVNMVTFVACALYRKSSVVRWQYYQAITQATFCSTLVCALLYTVGWAMAQLKNSAWREAFFVHTLPSSWVHDFAGIAGVPVHIVLVLVAGLGTYASTPEGSVNLLWFNTCYLVTLSVVWFIAVEVTEFGAMHCYADSDMQRLSVFVMVNITFSLFFLMHMLDSLNVYRIFGFELPSWCRHRLATHLDIYEHMVLEQSVMFDNVKEENLSKGAKHAMENAVSEIARSNKDNILRRPVLYIWRFFSVLFAAMISLIPVLRILSSSRHSLDSDEDLFVLSLCMLVFLGVTALGFFLCVDYVQLLKGTAFTDDIVTVQDNSGGPDERPNTKQSDYSSQARRAAGGAEDRSFGGILRKKPTIRHSIKKDS
jgi:hypothetical protein